MLLSSGVLCLCASLVGGFILNNESCDLSPHFHGGIPLDSDFTTRLDVPKRCVSGTFRWEYPRGHVMLHFSNPTEIRRKICVKDAIRGDIFNIVDFTNGVNQTLSPLVRDSPTLACTKPAISIENVVRIDAPDILYSVGMVLFYIEY